MFAIIKDNQIVKMGDIRAMFPDVSFPPSGPDEDWKNQNGIKEVVFGERKDERFYWVSSQEPTYNPSTGVVNAGFTSIAKDLNDSGSGRELKKGLKSQWIDQVKSTANSLLKQTDWMVIRKAEREVTIPTDVETYRGAVITEATRLEQALTSASNVEELITVIEGQNWPTL